MQRFFLSVCACLVLLAAAGCGGDSSTTSDSPSLLEQQEAAEAKEAGEEKAQAKEEQEELAALPKPKIPAGSPPKSLVVLDKTKGSGQTAQNGDEASMDYIGYVYKTKKLFEANWEKNEPFNFTLGAGEVIAGWDQGIVGMKVGGERELIIPPQLAYGSQGSYPTIPPNSTLVFLVKLLAVN
jgi:peptidylprolyl isomerase